MPKILIEIDLPEDNNEKFLVEVLEYMALEYTPIEQDRFNRWEPGHWRPVRTAAGVQVGKIVCK